MLLIILYIVLGLAVLIWAALGIYTLGYQAGMSEAMSHWKHWVDNYYAPTWAVKEYKEGFQTREEWEKDHLE